MMNYIIVFFISMVPLIELRGSILYATGIGLPFLPAYITAIIGNMLPVPFIFLFARKILVWGADKPVIGRFFSFCLMVASSKFMVYLSSKFKRAHCGFTFQRKNSLLFPIKLLYDIGLMQSLRKSVQPDQLRRLLHRCLPRLL